MIRLRGQDLFHRFRQMDRFPAGFRQLADEPRHSAGKRPEHRFARLGRDDSPDHRSMRLLIFIDFSKCRLQIEIPAVSPENAADHGIGKIFGRVETEAPLEKSVNSFVWIASFGNKRLGKDPHFIKYGKRFKTKNAERARRIRLQPVTKDNKTFFGN